MVEWFRDYALWLTLGAVATSLGGLAVAFMMVIMMPADHFTRPDSPETFAGRHPALRILARVLKNLLGSVLLVMGLIMAIPMVPGPGVLFILLGLSLTDIPGKRALKRYIISRPLVLYPINTLRAKWNRPPLQVPDHPQSRFQ